MNRYFKVQVEQTDIKDVVIFVDTLDSYVPQHFDKISNEVIPATGGYIVLNFPYFHCTSRWQYCGNFENIDNFKKYCESIYKNKKIILTEIDQITLLKEYHKNK